VRRRKPSGNKALPDNTPYVLTVQLPVMVIAVGGAAAGAEVFINAIFQTAGVCFKVPEIIEPWVSPDRFKSVFEYIAEVEFLKMVEQIAWEDRAVRKDRQLP